MPRYARKRDDNEAAIVEALRAAGATVTRLGEPGVPDLLVGYRGRNFLLEVKEPGQTEHRRRSEGGRGELTAAQVEWWDEWRGERAAIVHSVADALMVINGGPLGPGDGVFGPSILRPR